MYKNIKFITRDISIMYGMHCDLDERTTDIFNNPI